MNWKILWDRGGQLVKTHLNYAPGLSSLTYYFSLLYKLECFIFHHWEKPFLHTWRITIILGVFEVANQLLTRHSLCLVQWMNGNAFSFKPWIKSNSSCSLCSTRYLTSERSERARYRVECLKRNSVSLRAHVLFSMFIRLRFVQDMDALRVKQDQLELTLLVGICLFLCFVPETCNYWT